MKTLILDNFDSFTFNLYQYLAELGGNPEVYRNNELTLGDIERRGYTHIVISPGPGTPAKKKDFGICGDVIKHFAGRIPILGVCLGHQGIIHVLGGRVIHAPAPVHGKRSVIRINSNHLLFRGLQEEVEVMRYHSLVGERKSLPKTLEIIGETKDDKLIMAVGHKILPVYGVQFHPESIGTPTGKIILKNFLETTQFFKQSLSVEEAEALFYKMADGKLTDDQIADELRSLAKKGESVSEIVGMARGMRKHALKLALPGEEVMDTCGTGGSGLSRMNISTTAAFVLAACGVKIAKHGNRAASGRCGSFDVLEALGINISLPPEAVIHSIRELGIGFIFAPLFHPAMKRIAPIRKKLGIRTIFNLIGPLANPAQPQYHLLGTTDPKTAETLIGAMQQLGYRHAIVVTGEDGLDDVTLAGRTHVYELDHGSIRRFMFSPEEVGLKRVQSFKEISGGSAEKNAELFLALLSGKAPKALQQLLLLNCAFALVVREVVPTVREGIALARRAISSGAAYEKFLAYKNLSQLYRPFHQAIRGKNHLAVIAELKRRSPSFGEFPQHDVKTLIRSYEEGGAAALSVVTDEKRFGGSLKLLQEMKTAGSKQLPIIRKDFIKTLRDIDETAEAGANAVLLIAADISTAQLKKFVEHAHRRGLDTVIEIHTESDLKKLKGLYGIIVGINNRNLKNLKTDVRHAQKLLDKIDGKHTIIVESGFSNPKELEPYRGKVDAVLIGTSLLTAENPKALLRSYSL